MNRLTKMCSPQRNPRGFCKPAAIQSVLHLPAPVLGWIASVQNKDFIYLFIYLFKNLNFVLGIGN